jgi:hypothetical protein
LMPPHKRGERRFTLQHATNCHNYDEPVPKFELGLVTSLDKLRGNGLVAFVVSHFGKLRKGLLNHEGPEHPDWGMASCKLPTAGGPGSTTTWEKVRENGGEYS